VTLPESARDNRQRPWPRLLALVAVVLLALIAWQMLRPAPSVLSESTQPGEVREVPLPDGSLAVLAAGSRLTVPVGYGPEHRTVRLDGEAWFHVLQEGQPFIVQAGNFAVHDLGTTFAVAARRHHFVQVVVVEGSVAVRSLESGVQLTEAEAGDVADFHQDGALLAVHHAQPVDRLTSWRSRELRFVDAPLMDVLERLSTWYAREIRIAPALTIGRAVTATLPVDSFDAALAALTTLLGVEVVPDGDDGVWLQ
jgi:transmembrane sensor